jgi:hypothetical protein
MGLGLRLHLGLGLPEGLGVSLCIRVNPCPLPVRLHRGPFKSTAPGVGIGLAAARRALRVSGPRRMLSQPMIIEIEPRENIAAGRFGWGPGPWASPGSVRRVSVLGDGRVAPDAAEIVAAAAGRSLAVVVRDAHRDQNTRSLVNALLAARPDLVLVEMGLPLWRPPEGTSYLATYGASRASAHAAAEFLGLTLTAWSQRGGAQPVADEEGEGDGAGRVRVAGAGTG